MTTQRECYKPETWKNAQSRPRKVKAWNAVSINKKLRKLDVPPCSPGPTPSSRKCQVPPKRFRRSIERKPAVHIKGWFVTAVHTLQREEGCAVLVPTESSTFWYIETFDTTFNSSYGHASWWRDRHCYTPAAESNNMQSICRTKQCNYSNCRYYTLSRPRERVLLATAVAANRTTNALRGATRLIIDSVRRHQHQHQSVVWYHIYRAARVPHNCSPCNAGAVMTTLPNSYC